MSELDRAGASLNAISLSHHHLLQAVTKPNVVEFVILGPSMARMALSWVARPRSVESVLKKWKQQQGNSCKPLQPEASLSL